MQSIKTMRRTFIAAGSIALAAVASAAPVYAAASVTNRDDKDHKITLIEGEAKKDYTLKPNQALENICAKGCVLRLNDSDDDEYQIEPQDIVSIEDGYLYYDNQEAEPEDPKKEEPKKQ